MNDKPEDTTPLDTKPQDTQSDGDDNAQGEARLRWQLRGMRKDLPPARDLWPQIGKRISATPAVQARRQRPRQRWAPLALAASLLLAVGLAWQLRPLPGTSNGSIPRATQLAAGQPSSRLLDREAEAMSREYGAALSELRAATPLPSTPTQTAALQELDRSVAQIRSALARDPDARFLLDRLRRTYAQRLALTQRAIPT